MVCRSSRESGWAGCPAPRAAVLQADGGAGADPLVESVQETAEGSVPQPGVLSESPDAGAAPMAASPGSGHGLQDMGPAENVPAPGSAIPFREATSPGSGRDGTQSPSWHSNDLGTPVGLVSTEQYKRMLDDFSSVYSNPDVME